MGCNDQLCMYVWHFKLLGRIIKNSKISLLIARRLSKALACKLQKHYLNSCDVMICNFIIQQYSMNSNLNSLCILALQRNWNWNKILWIHYCVLFRASNAEFETNKKCKCIAYESWLAFKCILTANVLSWLKYQNWICNN